MKDFYLNIDIELKGKTLYIGEECSSGCKYKVNNKEELLQYIKNYIEDCVDYELDED